MKRLQYAHHCILPTKDLLNLRVNTSKERLEKDFPVAYCLHKNHTISSTVQKSQSCCPQYSTYAQISVCVWCINIHMYIYNIYTKRCEISTWYLYKYINMWKWTTVGKKNAWHFKPSEFPLPPVKDPLSRDWPSGCLMLNFHPPPPPKAMPQNNNFSITSVTSFSKNFSKPKICKNHGPWHVLRIHRSQEASLHTDPGSPWLDDLLTLKKDALRVDNLRAPSNQPPWTTFSSFKLVHQKLLVFCSPKMENESL